VAVMQRLGDWFEQRRDDFANLPSYEAEIDHLEGWQGQAGRLGQTRQAVRLLWLLAYPPYHRGQYQRAHDLVESALARFEKTVLLDPTLEAHLRNDLGGTLSKLGNHRASLNHEQNALAIRRAVLGEKHADTARSLNNVGQTLGELGDHRKALEHKQKAVEIQCELLGEKHPDTAISLNNVGISLGELGDDRKALEYYQKALSIQREVLGERHPDTANSLNNVGATFNYLGDPQEALQHGQRALDIRRESLGESHPDTAASFNNVGSCHRELGQLTKAIRHWKKALTVRLTVLGDRHPDTMGSWEDIVRLLLSQRTPIAKMEALRLVETDSKKFPNNPTLKRLKNEILGKRSAKPANKKPKPKKH